MPVAKAFLLALRPTHWVKNLIIAGPLVFSLSVFDKDRLVLTALAIVIFSALASAVYLLNDIADREKDRRHPVKRFRPIASGALPIGAAWTSCAILLAGALWASWDLSPWFALCAALYFVNNILYSFWIKHVVILDVMALAAGFVLRVIAGAVAIGVPASEWLIMCTILLAMFLGFAKRRHELVLLASNAESHRKVLDEYSAYFLDQMILIAASATVVCYALYTVAPHTIKQFGTDRLIYTVPFVLYGLFRYLYLVHQKESGGNPTKTLLTDKPTLVNVALWLSSIFLLIYRHTNTLMQP